MGRVARSPAGAGPAADAARTKGGERAFTVIEILVVLLVLALATTIAMANLNTLYRRSQLETEAFGLAAFLSSVPNRAREIRGSVFLLWDELRQTYVIAVDAAGNDEVDRHSIAEVIVVSDAVGPVLRCDTLSRAYEGASVSMMGATRTMVLAHSMDGGSPRVSYRLTLSPLWAVVVEKQLD